MSDTQQWLTSAEAAARQAGQILIDLKGRVRAREKAPADLVTEADFAAQQAIEERLRADFPDFYFIGEESEAPSLAPPAMHAEAYCWIVDPLDGTTNFVHGLDNYCVSIALRQGADIILGVIYDPNRDQLFHGLRGQGAFVNGERLQVSRTEQLSQALVASSFAARVPPESPEVRRFVQVLHRARAVRRLGSAALNLCYVAAGQLDAYWATSVQLWDVAAGLLLVDESGGTLSDITGEPLDLDAPQFLVAATRPLHDEMLRTLRIDSAAA